MTWPRNVGSAGKGLRRNLHHFRRRVMRLNALSRGARKKELEFRSQKSEKPSETDPTG